MSSPENPREPSSDSAVSIEKLQAAYQSLRNSFFLLLVMCLIFSGSYCVFVLRQITFVRRQANELVQFMADYEKTSVPLMNDFRNRLENYAKSDRNFNTVLAKYFGTNNAPASATAAPPAVVKPPK